MRTWPIALVLAIASITIAPAAAFAQARPREGLDVERFKPALTPDGFVTAEGSAVRPTQDRWQAGLFLNYALNPLVVVDQTSSIRDRIVAGRLGVDLIGSVSVLDWLSIGAGVPFFLAQTGDGDPSFAGLGDVRLMPKVRLLDDREHIGLALAAELRLPTHAGDFSGGARNVVFVPRLIVDHRFGASGFRLGANAGVSVREPTRFENVEAGTEVIYALAASYRIGGWDGIAAIGAEVNGAAGVTSVDLEELPLEGFVYADVNPTKEWQITFGPGIGIVSGYGVPTFRAFAGVRYSPTRNDRDGDGIPDDVDFCPDEPEDFDGTEDLDGCPEDYDELDSDSDGIPDSRDECPHEKETINGIDDDDGCPDGGDPRVVRQNEQLLVLDNIEFATGSAILRPASYPILDQVALMMKANRDILLLRIEGHTDSRGNDAFNLRLSDDRAHSVRNYLIAKGIQPGRLRAIGFGETRPLVEEVDDAALQKNRRVEFIIQEVEEPAE